MNENRLRNYDPNNDESDKLEMRALNGLDANALIGPIHGPNGPLSHAELTLLSFSLEELADLAQRSKHNEPKKQKPIERWDEYLSNE